VENKKIVIKYIEQLPAILDKYGISKNDICIGGSSVLSIFAIKEKNNDLDIVIKPNVRQKIIQQYNDELNILSSGTICFNENIQSCVHRYDNVGISEDKIVNSNQYHFLYEGWKVARIEIELAAKIKKGRDKDILDLKNSVKFLSSYSDFDWDFFRKCLSYSIQNNQNITIQTDISENKPTKKSTKLLNRVLRLSKRILKLILKIVRIFLLNPKKIFLKIEKVINKTKKLDILQIPVNSELASITDFMTSPATLLGIQFKNGVFNRYDVILRYLSIEKIESGFENPFDEYNMMQKSRVNRNTADNFQTLISSIKNNGFSTKYPLPIDLDANLIDGSHRLACSLYFDIDKIPYTVIQSNSNIQYGLDWFQKQEFDENTLAELERVKKNLFLRKGIYFCATIWGAAKEFYEDISNDISAQYNIVYQEDLFLGDNYGNLIDDIYAIDDIDGWKVLTKKQLLCQSPKEIRFILFEIPQPDFRIKQRNHSYLSSKGAALKKMIREKYCSKISDYFYDIIIHTGDNYEHNEEMIKSILKHTTINIDKIK